MLEKRTRIPRCVFAACVVFSVCILCFRYVCCVFAVCLLCFRYLYCIFDMCCIFAVSVVFSLCACVFILNSISLWSRSTPIELDLFSCWTCTIEYFILPTRIVHFPYWISLHPNKFSINVIVFLLTLLNFNSTE